MTALYDVNSRKEIPARFQTFKKKNPPPVTIYGIIYLTWRDSIYGIIYVTWRMSILFTSI